MNTLLRSCKDLLNAGLGFIYPEVCQICGEARATPDESYLCAGCRAAIQPINPPFCEQCGSPFQGAITNAFECANCREHDWAFSKARSAVVARDQMLEIIHRYKYQRALWFEPFLAGLLIERARSEIVPDQWDWIVPVPLHPTKQREREFNQAERISRHLSRATGVPLNTHLLRRIIPTRTQTLLSREERLANVRNAFVLVEKSTVKGKHIVLIDDVFTTGATTGACARVLKSKEASEVCVWTVARGL